MSKIITRLGIVFLELRSGNLFFDFQDNVISLGKFSPLVDVDFVESITSAVEDYKTTGKLPNR